MERIAASFPSPEEGLALHLRLLALDAVAWPDLCAAYVGPLTAWLKQSAPRYADPDQRQDAVHQAVMNYLKNPKAYDPRQSELGAYLRRAARADLLNVLQRERRHRRHRVAWKVVEPAGEGGNYLAEKDDPSDPVERREETERWRVWLREQAAGFTEMEQRVLDLMLQGEHSYRLFADALGLGHLPVAEQNREVKRVKDRMVQRLKRGARSHE